MDGELLYLDTYRIPGDINLYLDVYQIGPCNRRSEIRLRRQRILPFEPVFSTPFLSVTELVIYDFVTDFSQSEYTSCVKCVLKTNIGDSRG